MFDRENSLWVKYNFDISNVYYKEKWKFLYFTFNTTGTDSDINTSNDLYLKGGDTIYTLKVPRGLGSSVHLIMERKESSDATVRIILA